MKYILVLADGMADEPVEELKGRTPMEVSHTPHMDALARKGQVGLVQTVPKGMKPGSDTANLSVLGYNPEDVYTGRSPLEAVSIGAPMSDQDVCYRVNFVTLTETGDFDQAVIEDHSADEISTEEAAGLLEAIKDRFEDDNHHFYVGTSYRHALIINQGSVDLTLTPPHNILGQKIQPYLPQGDLKAYMTDLMRQSYDLLKNHEINIKRKEKGLRPANCLWPWGEGTPPALPAFESLYHKKGAMISAVDLLKGIALAADMESIDVQGATGNIHTNYQGKVQACLDALNGGCDFVYLHIEAPDECGHRGEVANKVKAIELIDEKVLAPLRRHFKEEAIPYRLLVLPDHPTPLNIRTHTSDPVPFLLYDSSQELEATLGFTEKEAKKSDWVIKKGHDLMTLFLNQ